MQTLLSAFGSSVLCFDFTFFSTFAPPPSAKMLPKPKPFGFGLALISCTSSLFVSSAEATRYNVALPSSHSKIMYEKDYNTLQLTIQQKSVHGVVAAGAAAAPVSSSIRSTKLDGKTPRFPLTVPSHQPSSSYEKPTC